jgi:hypothetical protein
VSKASTGSRKKVHFRISLRLRGRESPSLLRLSIGTLPQPSDVRAYGFVCLKTVRNRGPRHAAVINMPQNAKFSIFYGTGNLTRLRLFANFFLRVKDHPLSSHPNSRPLSIVAVIDFTAIICANKRALNLEAIFSELAR